MYNKDKYFSIKGMIMKKVGLGLLAVSVLAVLGTMIWAMITEAEKHRLLSILFLVQPVRCHHTAGCGGI
jgi:hypothetical protein